MGSMRKGIKWQLYKTIFLILIVFKSKNRTNGIVYMLHILESLVHDIGYKGGKGEKGEYCFNVFSQHMRQYI